MTNNRFAKKARLNNTRSILLTSLLALPLLFSAGCSTSQETVIKSPVEVGRKAPEILTETENGAKMSLSQHKGSYVLVAFWDSGNTAARKAHAELQHIYNTYKDAEFRDAHGFCVFSVSLDTDRDAWLKAVHEDGINWPCQTIDTGGWNAVSAKTYGVNYTPKYFLVDGEGKIIDKHVDIDMLDDALAEQLSKRAGRP